MLDHNDKQYKHMWRCIL